MKAISLWQPWASAIALRLKRNETRGWATRYRGPLAIHAAKRWQGDQVVFCDLACQQDERFRRLEMDRFQLGVVVAVVWLVDCQPTEAVLPTIRAEERLWGNYGPGRFTWLLEDVLPLPTPLPFAGRQGFFDVPQALLEPLVPSWFAKSA